MMADCNIKKEATFCLMSAAVFNGGGGGGCWGRYVKQHVGEHEGGGGGGGWDRKVKQKVGELEGGGGGGGLNLHPPPPVRQFTRGGVFPSRELVSQQRVMFMRVYSWGSRRNSWGWSCERCTAALMCFPVAGQHPDGIVEIWIHRGGQLALGHCDNCTGCRCRADWCTLLVGCPLSRSL